MPHMRGELILGFEPGKDFAWRMSGFPKGTNGKGVVAFGEALTGVVENQSMMMIGGLGEIEESLE